MLNSHELVHLQGHLLGPGHQVLVLHNQNSLIQGIVGDDAGNFGIRVTLVNGQKSGLSF